MVGQPGLFDLDVRYAALSATGDPLERLSAVVDFLDFHWGNWHWPAFNLADTAITLGVVSILLVDILFESRAEGKKDPGKEEER